MEKKPGIIKGGLTPLLDGLEIIEHKIETAVAEKLRKLMTHTIAVLADGATDFDKDRTLDAMMLRRTISFAVEETNAETMQTCVKIVNELREADTLTEFSHFAFDLNIPNGYATSEQVAEISKLDVALKGGLRARIFDSTKPPRTPGTVISTENDRQWSFRQVINSNRKINEVVGKIQSHRNPDGTALSPYEKYLAAYGWVASFSYNQGAEWLDIKTPLGKTKLRNPFLDKSTSRDPIKALESDKIVCVGYAKLLSKLCEQLGIPCVEQTCEVKNFKWKDLKEKGAAPEKEIAKNGALHQSNLVYLQDPKYNIDGIFYADACWDSKRKGENKSLYSMHAVSYDRVASMQKKHIDGLDFLELRDGKELEPPRIDRYGQNERRQRMTELVQSFEPQTFQIISHPDEIPSNDTYRALHAALSCDVGQVNKPENLYSIMTQTVELQDTRFQPMEAHQKHAHRRASVTVAPAAER